MKRLDCTDCNCPKGTGSDVKETRMDTRYGFTWRRRSCLGCGEIFESYEIPASSVTLRDFVPIDPNGGIARR
jgi:transcriptional regulator NrdR family protein